jgi:hypothetical protein
VKKKAFGIASNEGEGHRNPTGFRFDGMRLSAYRPLPPPSDFKGTYNESDKRRADLGIGVKKNSAIS